MLDSRCVPRRFLVLLCGLGAGACGPAAGSGGPDGGSSGGAADASTFIDADPNRPDARPAPPEGAAVYAHSNRELYRVDPDTLEVELVGTFKWSNGIDQMTDIAIDKDGNMFGTSYSRVYRVDKDTAACTYLADVGNSFNGLSFVPAPGPDPNQEILIGATIDGSVYRVEPTTGESTLLGNYGDGIGSSGDIVFVRGFGTVATVKTGGGTDQLASIDVNGGFTATVIGDTGATDIWGLGFWGNRVYGFTDNQQFVLIDPATGQATPVETAPVKWWGAAVTTSAPVIE